MGLMVIEAAGAGCTKISVGGGYGFCYGTGLGYYSGVYTAFKGCGYAYGYGYGCFYYACGYFFYDCDCVGEKVADTSVGC